MDISTGFYRLKWTFGSKDKKPYSARLGEKRKNFVKFRNITSVQTSFKDGKGKILAETVLKIHKW